MFIRKQVAEATLHVLKTIKPKIIQFDVQSIIINQLHDN